MNSEWPIQPLSQVAEVITGFPFKGEDYLPPHKGVRVVRGDNVTERYVRWGEKEKCWSEISPALQPYVLRTSDIVIGMDGSKVGKNFAAIGSDDNGTLLAQRVARVRAREGACQDYLRYAICNPLFTDYVKAVHTGTSIPHISKGQIEKFEIRVPPLQKQISIAAILSALDDRITLLRETNTTLEAIAQALFKLLWSNKKGHPIRLKD
jgi:type I restriction enzyme S subunit